MNSRRLAAVLHVRELQERGARGELARTNDQLRQATNAEAHTWRSLDRPIPARSLSSHQVGAYHAVRTAGTLAADGQRTTTQHAEVGVAVALDEWTVAARRVEALERLGERSREVEALDAERARNNEIDDLVLARHGRGVGS